MENEEINFELIFTDKSYEDRTDLTEFIELLASIENLDSNQEDKIPIRSFLSKILTEDKELLQKLAQ